MIDEPQEGVKQSKKVDGGGDCNRLRQSLKKILSQIKTQTFTTIKSTFFFSIKRTQKIISKRSICCAILTRRLTFLLNFYRKIFEILFSRNPKLGLKKRLSGYVLILFIATLPVILFGTKWVLDKMTADQVTIEQSKGTVTYFKRSAKEAALAVAKNWNPGLTLSQQKDALMKVADAVYNDNLCYMFNDADTGIVGSAITGLDEKKSVSVSQTGSKFNPIKVTYGETKTHSSIMESKEIKYTDEAKYLLRYYRGYYTEKYDGTGGGYENVYHRIWRETDMNTRPEYRYSYFDEIDETERAQQNYVLKHHDIYILPCRANPTDLLLRKNDQNQLYYPNNSYFWPGCSTTHNRFYITIPSTETSVTQYQPWKYHTSNTVAANYTTVSTTTYKTRTTPSGTDPVVISIDDDRIKVTTDFDTGYPGTVAYAKPAELNVDIVLAVPVNGAASNANNNDTASTTAEYPATANEATQTSSFSSSTTGTPIYQMGQALKKFVKDNFYHIRGVTMGLIPYSAKVSISPDKTGYTIVKPAFVDNTASTPIKPYYPTAAMYGTRGEAGANLVNSYVWNTILTGCPIMCRLGNTTTWRNTQLACGNLLSNANPSDGDQYKYMRMNLNPCLAGYANQLSMKCERKCTNYFPNPYYMIEPTADMVKIYEMCNALFPVYDPNNVSNFLFIPFEWANNFWQSWTTDVTVDASTDTLSRPSKTTENRKKALIVLVNKPDWFESGEMTYLGFDNDYSAVPLTESDKIDFSINYSDTTKKYLYGSSYSGTPYGPKKIVYFTGMSRDSTTGYYESTGNAICRLYFPRRCRVKVTVKPKANKSGGVNWTNWKYYPQALNPSGYSSSSTWNRNGIGGAFAMAYGNGKFVVLSSQGYLSYSSDGGCSWSRGSAVPPGDSWNAMAWNGSNFLVLTGYCGYASHSPDGILWSSYSVPSGLTTGYLDDDLSWDGSKFFACTDSSVVVYTTTTPDGSSGWSNTGSSSRISDYEQFKYGGGYYVRRGKGDTSYVKSSTNLYSGFTLYNIPLSRSGALNYGPGYWLILTQYGDLMKSTDASASSWSIIDGNSSNTTSSSLYKLSSKTDWVGICYGDGNWVAYTRSGDVAVLDTTPTESTIRFTNVTNENTLYTIKDEKTFTIEPSQLASDTSCYVEFNAYDIQMVSAEITNTNFTICKPVQVDYTDVDYNAVSMTKIGTPTVSTVTETIDFSAGYDSCHVGKFMVDQTKAIGDAKMNRDSGSEGYELSAADGSEIPCRIEADYPCDVQLEVEPIINPRIIFYRENIGDTYDVKQDGSSINIGSSYSHLVPPSGTTFVFSGGQEPSGHYLDVTSTRGPNFGHNLSLYKVRYSCTNCYISDATLTDQWIRDYEGQYGRRQPGYKQLILSDGTLAIRDNCDVVGWGGFLYSTYSKYGIDGVYTSGTTFDNLINAYLPQFRDPCYIFRNIRRVKSSSCSGTEYSNFMGDENDYSCTAYGVQGNSSFYVLGWGNSHWIYMNSRTIGFYGDTSFASETWGRFDANLQLNKEIIFNRDTGGSDNHWILQTYVRNGTPKYLQSTTVYSGLNSVPNNGLTENKGIYLVNLASSINEKIVKGDYICFNGDGELSVTVNPIRISTPTFNLYTISGSATTEDGITVGYNNSSTQALNVGATGVSVDSSYTDNPTSSKTITIPKEKFIWNGDSTAHDYHLLFSCRDLRIKKATLKYNLFARSYKLQASKSGTALVRVSPTNSITSSTTTSNALETWVNRGNPLNSISSDWYYNGNHLVYGNGKFVIVSNYSGIVAQSKDGISWIKNSQSINQCCCGVTFGNGHFIKLDYNNYYYYSGDGVSWTRGSVHPYSLSATDFRTAVTFGNGMFLTTNTGGYVCAMNDASNSNWKLISDANLSSLFQTYNRPAFGNGLFVMSRYSSDNEYYSYDGKAWIDNGAKLKAGTTSYGDIIAYGNGKFIFLHNQGYMSMSNDGFAWSWIGSSSTNYPGNVTGSSSEWYNLAYGKGRWVAINKSGYVATCDEPLAGCSLVPWYKVGSGSQTEISSDATMSISLSDSTDSDGKYYAEITLYNAEAKGSVLIYDDSRTVYDVIPFYNGNAASLNSSYRALKYSGASGSHIGNDLYSYSGSGTITLQRRGKLRLKFMPNLNTQKGTFKFTTGSDTSEKTVTGPQEFTISVGNQANNGNYDYVSFDMTDIVLVKAEFESEPKITSPSASNSQTLMWNNGTVSTSGTNIDLLGTYENYSLDEGWHRLMYDDSVDDTGTERGFYIWNNSYVSDITSVLDAKSPILAYWYMPQYVYTDYANTNLVGPVRLFSPITRDSSLTPRKYCRMSTYSSSYNNKANLMWHNFTLPVNLVLMNAGYQSAGGDATVAVGKATEAVCAKLKTDYGDNLRVYIVKYRKQAKYKTFPNCNMEQTDVDHDYSVIDACASSSSYVYDISTEADLKTTLNSIANNIKSFAGGVTAAKNVD